MDIAFVVSRRRNFATVGSVKLLARGAAALFVVVAACGRAAPSAPAASTDASPVSSPVAATSLDGGLRCGELACESFATPEAAFARVLGTKPRVLAIGETHAQKEADGGSVLSSTKRFSDAFIPLLAGHASDLVLELWIANGSCGKAEKAVAAAQKPVTETQAPTNQNEFITLGDVAKKSGIRPHALIPSCDEYARILDAGGGDIDTMLSMIARLTARDLELLLTSRADAAPDAMLLAYGGAMHNDLVPRPGREAWSFGPAMEKATAGRYVELDLIVPEAIKDTDAWRSLPWYAHFDDTAQRVVAQHRTLLITLRPRSYVLVFPKSS
jgi:hypothetical protein